MRKIKITFNKNKFFSEEDPPEEDGMPDQPNEPTDYLHGNPATVLDLKEPLVKFNESEDPGKVREVYINTYPDDFSDPFMAKVAEGLISQSIDGYRNVVNNYNKESAINRRLNELGSTDYDLSGESFRKLPITMGGPLTSHVHNSNTLPSILGWILPESVHIGTGKDDSANTSDIIAHELGHTNDPDLSYMSHGKPRTDQHLREVYGDKFVDSYNNFDGSGISDDVVNGHDKLPSEVYADAASVRSSLFKSGAWNGKDPITEDMVNDYLESEREYMNSINDNLVRPWGAPYSSNAQRMSTYFKLPDIVNILNSSRRYSI